MSSKIIYTLTDEAPFLATYSLLPILKKFVGSAGVDMDTKDISLAARVLSQFSDHLNDSQRVEDDLALLGKLVKNKEANVIKLPNISASIPQLKACIDELRAQGYMVPLYPESPGDDNEKQIKSKYDKIKGSAVNPVLREGNSDRRAPKSVKNYAKNNPHSMGEWKPDSKTHVSTMTHGDFAHNEQSIVLKKDDILHIVLDNGSSQKSLKENIVVLQGEVVDGSFMSRNSLLSFFDAQIKDAKEKGVLFSLHMKATMMKVSDPIIFGLAVETFFKPVFEKYDALFTKIGVNVRNGFGDLIAKIASLDSSLQKEIESALTACFSDRPDLAMVNSDKGITNLHIPSDVIIDASMPAMIRTSGQMWNKLGKPQDTKAVIPDSSYAGVYQATIQDCMEHGALDPTTMGTVPNIGLMAQKAEEYGSHDKTFEISEKGVVLVKNSEGEVLMKHDVEKGDIWRMCTVKDAPIQDWVKLAVSRAKISQTPAVFWLDENRAHDRQLIEKVNTYLKQHDTAGIDIQILSPVDATKFSLGRIRKGEDTISVTGNVLRDYLTDLFPILELGTSAKMLSIVPLMNGGGLFETGAGGSAPKHVDQLLHENHLRWDSLGEFLALAVSLEHLGRTFENKEAMILAETLDLATSRFLEENKSPSRKAGERDNRGSHFYLALFWAEQLSLQTENARLKNLFEEIYNKLKENEALINTELLSSASTKVDIGGYYHPNKELLGSCMRPSPTLNAIIESI